MSSNYVIYNLGFMGIVKYTFKNAPTNRALEFNKHMEEWCRTRAFMKIDCTDWGTSEDGYAVPFVTIEGELRSDVVIACQYAIETIIEWGGEVIRHE